ncbi:unnamed protein product [Cyprideis torosa]|nr:unnamed protein product [Cyprideis torosa]CAG0891920.1 unnamed protein product [Cyprideis torosa]
MTSEPQDIVGSGEGTRGEDVHFAPSSGTWSEGSGLLESHPPSNPTTESTVPSSRQRRPFHYHYGSTPTSTSLPAASTTSSTVAASKPKSRRSSVRNNPPDDPQERVLSRASSNEQAMYSRFRYYSRLSTNIGTIPHHVIPAPFFAPLVGFPADERTPIKQSSFITIFAIWSTMMGTSILSMPWAIHKAGLALGIALMVVMTGLCLYTAWRVITLQKTARIPGIILELPALNGYFLGKWAEYATVFVSVFALIGAAIVYWVLLSNFLFHTVSYFHDEITNSTAPVSNGSLFNVICPNITSAPPAVVQQNISAFIEFVEEEQDGFNEFWTLNLTAPLTLVPVLGPLLNFQSPTFFTKFTSLGTLSVFYIITFISIKINKWGFLRNVNFQDATSIHYISLAKPATAHVISGILALALFIHNAIITIVSHQENPKNNKNLQAMFDLLQTRDLIIAYLLVSGTYLIVGLSFYLGFPLSKDCIEDNFLNNFVRDDVLAMVARVFLFFQMLTVFPLLVYVIRTQVFYVIYGSPWPSLFRVIILNCLVITICVLFAIFLPHIGTVIRFSGAFCGMVLVFLFPPMAYLRASKLQGTISVLKIVVHMLIVLFGILNFIMQFV